MASNSLLTLRGAVQGEIKGSVVQKGREGKIMVIAFDHEIQSPRDLATGQATGRRIHRPFVITKEIDQSSPLLYTALANNENMVTWELQCFVPKSSGVETNHYTVKLTDAKITDIRSFMLNNKMTENNKMPLMEEVGFVYEKIEWTWVAGGITATDDWGSGRGKSSRAKTKKK